MFSIVGLFGQRKKVRAEHSLQAKLSYHLEQQLGMAMSSRNYKNSSKKI
ncbi:MAG: hypothetical protein ABL865_00785 [Candidatus Nitrotoga sp.]